MAATLVRRVMLQILAEDGEAAVKLDRIKAKAEELRLMHPDLKVRVNTAEAQAKMAVLRDELKATSRESMGLSRAWEGTKYALLGVGAGLAYGMVKAVSFQQEMTRLNTQAGVSKSQLKVLGDGVLQLAGQVGESPNSLAESLFHVESNFASMGISAPKALSLVKVAAEGARVGGANLVDVTNALTAAVASGIPGVKNFQGAMGMLNATIGSGDMKMQDLADAFGSGMVAVVKGYGLSLKDVGAALATFGDNNIRGAVAGTDLRMAVQALAVQAKGAAPLMKELGLGPKTLANDMQNGGLLKALDDLTGRFHKVGITSQTEGQAITTLFGKKAGAGIAVLLEQMDRLHSKYPAITEGAKKFGEAWKTQAKTPAQQMADLKNGAQALAIQLGQHLLPAATKVMGWLNSFLQSLQKGSAGATGIAAVIGTVLTGIALKKLEGGLRSAVEGFEGLWRSGGKVLSWSGSLAGKLASAGSAVGSFTAQTVRQLGRAAAATGAWIAKQAVAAATFIGENIAMAASATAAFIAENLATLGLVAGIGLLVAGIIFLALHWKRVWHDIKAIVGDAVKWIKEHWKLILEILTGPVGMAAVFIIDHWKKIANGFKHAWNDIKNWAADAWHFLDHIWNNITSGVSRLWHDVVAFFDKIKTGAVNKFNELGDFMRSLPGKLLNALGNLGSLLWNTGKDLVQGLINGVTSMFGAVASTAGNLVSSLGHSVLHLLGIGSPSKVAHWWGEMVAHGFANGIAANSHLPANAAAVMAARVAGGLGGPGGHAAALAGAGGRSGRLELEWVGGSADQALITLLKRHIRVRGGDPGVLGR